jgi:hypothetical protein
MTIRGASRSNCGDRVISCVKSPHNIFAVWYSCNFAVLGALAAGFYCSLAQYHESMASVAYKKHQRQNVICSIAGSNPGIRSRRGRDRSMDIKSTNGMLKQGAINSPISVCGTETDPDWSISHGPEIRSAGRLDYSCSMVRIIQCML